MSFSSSQTAVGRQGKEKKGKGKAEEKKVEGPDWGAFWSGAAFRVNCTGQQTQMEKK